MGGVSVEPSSVSNWGPAFLPENPVRMHAQCQVLEPGWEPGLILEPVPLTTTPHGLPTWPLICCMCLEEFQTLPGQGTLRGAHHGHGGCHLWVPLLSGCFSPKVEVRWGLQLCLAGGVGLRIPFTKPTPKRDLFWQVLAHSNVGPWASSMYTFFKSLRPRATVYFERVITLLLQHRL